MPPFAKTVRETPRDFIPTPSSREFDGVTRCDRLRELLAKHEEPCPTGPRSERLLDRLAKFFSH